MSEPDRWLGIHVLNHGEMTIEEMLDVISLAEDHGVSGVTVNEDVGHDAFAVLASAASRTSRIALGTAIMNIYTRSAMQIAMGAATLNEVSSGRFALGLSVGHHPWNDIYHGIPIERAPLAWVREYVAFIRGVLAGGRYDHDGKVFKGVSTQLEGQFQPMAVPIFVGGDRGGVLRLSGEIADGAIMNVVSPDYIRTFAADRFFSAAREAGRQAESLELTVIVTCCLTAQRDEAMQNAKEAFLNRIESSPERRMETRTGVEREEIERLSDLIKNGERDQAVRVISESLVTSTFAVGTVEQIRETVERFYEAGATRVLLASSSRDAVSLRALITALSR